MIISRWTDFRAQFAISTTLGPDGVEVWPLNAVRSVGFTNGLTGIDRPIRNFPLTVSCNGQAADAGAADDYDWYLSQRTDDPTLQWLSITQYSDTQSGTVTIALTAKCVADMGLASTTADLDGDELIEILKHCTLYVQRRFTKGIQLVQLLQYTMSSY